MNKVIRIKIHQPSAHYRIPFSYRRRFTYPIPPFSTVKGFLCNLLGIKNENSEDFQNIIRKGLSLAIYGRYESIVKEYIWLRNLSVKSHKDRFFTTDNRTCDNIPEHPGGQMPCKIDVLHNVSLIIYISHTDKAFQNILLENIKNPANRNSTINLGRSEDWLVFEEIREIQPEDDFARKIPYFTWIPQIPNKEYLADESGYEDFFKNISGNLFRLPLFYTITENNERIFNSFAYVKLFEGGCFGRKYKFFVDRELDNLPIIFTKIQGDLDEQNIGEKQK